MLTTDELLQRVRRVEIKTRALTANVFAGQYLSAFKGRGISFSEARIYQPGDDVRAIDWNVTARQRQTYVKVYEEERELTVMLLIDVSGSLDFGTQRSTMRDVAAEIAATLAFSAVENGDRVGAILYSDRVEQFIPPATGRQHVLYIVRSLLAAPSERRATRTAEALRFATAAIKRRCIAFVISDFVDADDYARQLSIAARHHDVVPLRLYDQRMAELPAVGLVSMVDAETGQRLVVDTDSPQFRKAQARWWKQQTKRFGEACVAAGLDHADISTTADYVKTLMALFARRIA